jgi:hypothetical protein
MQAPVSPPVRTTSEADAQIPNIDAWWHENRRVAPDLFLEEPCAAFGMIADAPQIGRLDRQSPVPDTRRVLLKGTRYHV